MAPGISSGVVDGRLLDAADLYVDNRLREDRSPVGLHPLLWWLPGVLYDVKDDVDATGSVRRLVQLVCG